MINFDFTIQNKGELEILIRKVDIDVYANEIYVTRIYSDKDLIILPGKIHFSSDANHHEP